MHGPKWPFLLILFVYEPSVVFVKYWDSVTPRLERVYSTLYCRGVYEH